jgi:hypothetical protein
MLPSMTVSRRAISAPPRRPEIWILTPLAPFSIGSWTAFRIVRRKPERFRSWSATFSATSWPLSSGLLISRMSSLIVLLVILSRSPRSFSTLAPFRPIRMPGRAAWTMMLMASPCRSISIFGMPAKAKGPLMNFRIF